MRILGFSNKWGKLEKDYFTTFRFPRKDKDWWAGEVVQIVIKPRTKHREPLGLAKILEIEQVWLKPYTPSFYNDREYPGASCLSYGDARSDGFESPKEMIEYMRKTYSYRLSLEPMNKLTIKWF